MGDLLDIAAELGEVGIDAVLEDGILQDIPLLGTVIGIARASKSVRDNHLLKKIGRFLTPLAETAEKNGIDLREKLEEDPDFKEKLSELVSTYLDKYDDEIKAEYLGILLAACLRGNLSRDHFFRMAALVDRAFWGDLGRLQEFADAEPDGIMQSLSATQMEGFVMGSPVVLGDVGDDENRFNVHFEITPLGKEFLRIIQDYKAEQAIPVE